MKKAALFLGLLSGACYAMMNTAPITEPGFYGISIGPFTLHRNIKKSETPLSLDTLKEEARWFAIVNGNSELLNVCTQNGIKKCAIPASPEKTMISLLKNIVYPDDAVQEISER